MDIQYIIGNDFSQSNKEYESMWVDVENLKDKNILCAVIYRPLIQI